MGARRGDGAVWTALPSDAVLMQNDTVVTRIKQTETSSEPAYAISVDFSAVLMWPTSVTAARDMSRAQITQPRAVFQCFPILSPHL